MRSIVLICLLIGGLAVAMPSIFTHYVESSSHERPRQDAAAAASSREIAVDVPTRHQDSASSRQVEIKAERDGHFYVEAAVNFRPVRLMVDTGATVVALRVSDAEAAGIRVREADFTNPVQTANGTTNAAQALLESVSISDIELRNIRALIVPDDQLAISLLGGSFLHGLQRFEVANGTLIIEN